MRLRDRWRRRRPAGVTAPPLLPSRGGPAAPADGRLAALDSLRGIAALMVLAFHCWKIGLFAEPTGWAVYLWRWTPLNWLVTGRPWVILFFVLSGFVLALALERGKDTYGRFVLRRFCRIYLPFAASIALSALAWAALRPAPIEGLSSWFNTLAWIEPPTPSLIGVHLLMTGIKGHDSLNPVMWSLVYELRISLIFPVLWLAAARWPWATLLAAVAAHLAAALFVGCGRGGQLFAQCAPFRGDDLAESMALTGYFAVFFVLGILLAQYRQRIVSRLRRLSPASRAVLSVAAVYSVILPHVPRFAAVLPADAAFGLGAALMIVLALGSPAWSNGLQRRPLLWLGRISYSLYLTHNIVLLAVVHAFHAVLSGPVLVALVIIASLLVADLGYRLIEAPSIRLGRALAERGRRQAAAAAPRLARGRI